MSSPSFTLAVNDSSDHDSQPKIIRMGPSLAWVVWQVLIVKPRPGTAVLKNLADKQIFVSPNARKILTHDTTSWDTHERHYLVLIDPAEIGVGHGTCHQLFTRAGQLGLQPCRPLIAAELLCFPVPLVRQVRLAMQPSKVSPDDVLAPIRRASGHGFLTTFGVGGGTPADGYWIFSVPSTLGRPTAPHL